jgi:NAD+ kinase
LQKYNIKHDVVDNRDFYVSSNCKYDALFIIGGDGSILGRTEVSNLYNIPIIGVNAGKLGFLTEFEYKEVENAVKLLSENQLVIDKRITIKVVFNGKTYYALNDVLVQRVNSYNENSSTTTLKISVDDHDIDTIRGDGVIVSTPTGSTAYSLSAGGAIIDPTINCLLFTPVCPHSFYNARPIVFSPNNLIQIKAVQQNEDNTYLTVDGSINEKLLYSDSVNVKASKSTLNLIKIKENKFYDRVYQKISERK